MDQEHIIAAIKAAISDATGIEVTDIPMDKKISEIVDDSLATVSIYVDLETVFNVILGDEEIEDLMPTVTTLATLIQGKL